MRHHNGTITQVPRLTRELAGFGAKYMYFEAATRDIGPTYDRSTAGSFARLTGKLVIYYPMIVTAVKWDVRIADDYICRFVTAQNGTTSAFDVNTAVTVAAPGTATITPTGGDFLLLPGVHYLQLVTHDAATVQWWDKNDVSIDYTYYYSHDVYYTTTQYDLNIPVRLTARVGIYANMIEYIR